MSVMLHLMIALAYITVTAAVAIGLPQTVMGVDQTLAIAIAALGVLAGGLVHLTVVQWLHGRRAAALGGEQKRLAQKLMDICQALVDGDDTLLRAAAVDSAEEIAAERKVMRFLRSQIAPAAPR